MPHPGLSRMRRVSCAGAAPAAVGLSRLIRRVGRAVTERARVEGRTRLALGGMATATASIAVVCAVAMTTSGALVDAAGVTVDARAVVVPIASGSASASVAPTASPAPRATPATGIVAPETVPAPEPEDVAAPPVTSPVQAPEAAPAEPAPSDAQPSGAQEAQLVAEVEDSGSWDVVYVWARERGWSSERADALIERLASRVTGREKDDTAELTVKDTTSGNRTVPPLPPEADGTSGRDLSDPSSETKREQSRVPPD